MTSYEAYLHCKDVKDEKSIRKLITDSYDAYYYCKYAKDRKSMRDLITNKTYISKLDDIKLNKKDAYV